MERQTRRASALAIFLVFAPWAAHGGPPFRTDDPMPFEVGHGEAYLFSMGSGSKEGKTIDAAPGAELNYSLFPNTFFHLVLPMTYDDPSDAPSHYGLGDMEVGFKWRFWNNEEEHVSVGTFPIVVTPTGNSNKGLGNGQAQYYFPIWLQKDWDRLTVYGGGGYWVNPGANHKDWWFSGMVIQYQFTERLYLGTEFFHETADEKGASGNTGFNVGGGFILAKDWQILFSGGRNIRHFGNNEYAYYIGLYRSF